MLQEKQATGSSQKSKNTGLVLYLHLEKKKNRKNKLSPQDLQGPGLKVNDSAKVESLLSKAKQIKPPKQKQKENKPHTCFRGWKRMFQRMLYVVSLAIIQSHDRIIHC